MIIYPPLSRAFWYNFRVKKILTLAVLSLLMGTGGCFSIESAPLGSAEERGEPICSVQGDAVAHVVASNYGWYLFDCWPIVSGNITPGAEGRFVFFKNTVDEKLLLNRFLSYARERNCDVVDLQLFNNDEVLMTIGIGGLSIPLPYVISFRDMQYSGVLVKKSSQASKLDEKTRLTREMKSLLDRLPDGGAK